MKIQLYNIPSVDLYINKMIADFLKFSSDLSQGDILIADRINKLLDKSRYMLKNIDNFMNKNCLDPRVAYLYVTRNKLFKFIQKIHQNKLFNQVNSLQATQSYLTHKKSPFSKQTLILQQRQNIAVGSEAQKEQKKPTITSETESKNKSNTQTQQFQVFNDFEGFQSFERKPNKNPKKPDLIKIQPDSPAFMKARTPLPKTKPQNQYQKLQIQSKAKHVQKSKTPVKTSKKIQSFTPVKKSNNKFANQNQNWKGLKSARQIESDSNQQSAFVNSVKNPNTSPYSKRVHKTEKTPKKGMGQKSRITQSHLYNEYNNGSGNKTIQQKAQEPSSAIKNLSNLIFTIKMTKEEYNEFKKIKEQHQGRPILR